MHLVTLVLVILGIISTIALLSMLTGLGTSERTKYACTKLIEQVGFLTAASKQDSSPLFALIHASAAVAKVDALSYISQENNIKSIFNVSLTELSKTAREQQKAAVKRLGQEYPQLLPDESEAISAGWV